VSLNYWGETGISYSISRSVTQAVREVLTSNKFYFDVLQSGIANLTALAVKIKPEVEKLAGSSVSTNTIVASLKRVSDRLAENQESMRFDKKIPANLKMSLTDSIIDFVLDEASPGDFSEIYDRLSSSSDIPFNIFQTSKNCRLFTDNPSLFDELDKKYSEHFKAPEKKFTKVTIDFSDESQQESTLNNLLSEISNILHNSDISIHSAFFTPTEIIFIADDVNAIKLYGRLHNELISS
jgi:hypothetical protein